MPTRLDLLSADYDALASDGVPPGVDPAHYLATVTTLSQFTTLASTDLSVDDWIDGVAKYQVVRDNTVPLLAVLSKALGKTLVLQ